MSKRRHWTGKLRAVLAGGHPRPARRLKVRHVTVPKWRLGTASKVESIAYDTKGRPMILYRMQRRRPSVISYSHQLLKPNPDKVIIASCRDFGGPFQVFYYKSNPHAFFMARSGDLLSVPFDAWTWLRKVFRQKSPL